MATDLQKASHPSDIATVNFDRSGTTVIGKYLLNHSFMLPGLVHVVVATIAGYGISSLYHFAFGLYWDGDCQFCKSSDMKNNINKITSAGTLQPEWTVGFKPLKKLADILVRALRTRKRATVGMWKGHSCAATVAFLPARRGPFRPVFGIKSVSIKFRWLIVSTLKMSPNSPVCTEWSCLSQILQAESLKTDK